MQHSREKDCTSRLHRAWAKMFCLCGKLSSMCGDLRLKNNPVRGNLCTEEHCTQCNSSCPWSYSYLSMIDQSNYSLMFRNLDIIWTKMCIHWRMGVVLWSPDLLWFMLIWSFVMVHADEGQFDLFTLINWKSTFFFLVPQFKRILKACKFYRQSLIQPLLHFNLWRFFGKDKNFLPGICMCTVFKEVCLASQKRK